MKLSIVASFAIILSTSAVFAEDTKVEVKPGMVGGAEHPNNESGVPENPHQTDSPSAPGVIVTINPQGETIVKCTHNGKEVDC